VTVVRKKENLGVLGEVGRSASTVAMRAAKKRLNRFSPVYAVILEAASGFEPEKINTTN
jgi:hypothetical protein